MLITQLAGPLGINLGSGNEADRGFALTLANLSLLYRHAVLARLLNLSIADLFQLINLAAISGKQDRGNRRLNRTSRFFRLVEVDKF